MSQSLGEHHQNQRVSKLKYAAFLLFFIVGFGGISALKGGLYSNRHEADVSHMIDIVLRIAGGQTPHIDFSTPLGIMAFLPISTFVNAGFGIGMSFLLAQILVAVILAPMVFHTATSRLHGVAAWFFGLVTLTFVLSLVYGGDALSQSASMYYNRWSWAAAFIILFLAILPAHSGSDKPSLDGLFIGVLLAALAFSKPTFFLAFAIPVIIALMSRGAVRTLGAALFAGVCVAGTIAALYGFEFYLAYIRDLLTVASSSIRSAPGVSFSALLNSPAYLIATLSLVLSIIVLRQAGLARAGAMLLIFAPGFIYVTYQNFGNDPKWLLFLCIYLMAVRPRSGLRVIFNADARNATAALALVSFCLYAPSFQNLVSSPLRHYAQDQETYQLQMESPELSGGLVRDVWVKSMRANTMIEQTQIADRIPALTDETKKPSTRVQFLGEALTSCTVYSGDAKLQAVMAERLKQPPFGYSEASQFFVADILSVLWMEGGFEPLQNGAPWYYGGTAGAEHADAIVLPLCPTSAGAQKAALEALEASGLEFGTPVRDDLMIVYPLN
jgi:hypothetical protein